MTAAELIELLEGRDPDTEIRIATQPEWPLQFKVESLQVGYDDGETIAWITTGDHPQGTPYAPSAVFEG